MILIRLNNSSVSLPYIKRICFLIDKNSTDPNTRTLIERVLDLILEPDSPYNLFKRAGYLIQLLDKLHGDTSKYIRLYQKFTDPYLVSDLNRQMEIINKRYEFKIEQLSKEPVSEKTFGLLSELLDRKSTDLLLSTDSSDYITDNTSFYYNINQLYMKYYRNVSFERLKHYMIFRDYDNSIGMSRNFLSRKLEQTISFVKESEAYLLDENEDENIGCSNLVNDDTELGSDSSVKKNLKISISETICYWHCRWYLVYGSFIEDDYQEVLELFDCIIEQNYDMPQISAFEVIEKHFDSDVVINTNLLRLICLSILVCKEANKWCHYWSNPHIKRFLAKDKELKQFIDDYSMCNYSSALQLLERFEKYYEPDFQLSKCFPNIPKILRLKAYVSYLSLIQRVSVCDMADFFSIPESLLYSEVMELISLFDLNFKIDCQQGIIEYYKEASGFPDIGSKIKSIIRNTRVSSKATVVGSLVSKAFSEDKA
mgnify:FL=1